MEGILSGRGAEFPRGSLRQPGRGCLDELKGGGLLSPLERESLWCAVHTRSRHEYLVRDQLSAKSLRVFLPERLVWSRRRDRREQIWVPLFLGYLFVSAGEEVARLREVRCTRGVVRLLGVNGCPQPVSRREMDSLRKMVASGELLKPIARLIPGARVRVVEGPLAGVEGTILRSGGSRRLVVSIELLQRSVAAELAEWQLERAGGR